MDYRVVVYFWSRSNDGDDWVDSCFSKHFNTLEESKAFYEKENNKKDTIFIEIFHKNELISV